MKYENVIAGTFVRRRNRFVAKVMINGSLETVHVKNTGRMGELLFPDAKVTMTISDNPNRKTKYDLISADQCIQRIPGLGKHRQPGSE